MIFFLMDCQAGKLETLESSVAVKRHSRYPEMIMKIFLFLSLVAVVFGSDEAQLDDGKSGAYNIPSKYVNQLPASYEYGLRGDYRYRGNYARIPYYCPAIHKCFDGSSLKDLYFRCPVLYPFDCKDIRAPVRAY